MARNLNVLSKLNLLYNLYNSVRPKTASQVMSKLRLYSSAAATTTKSDSGVPAPTYQKMDHEYRISKKATVKTLVELLNIKTLDAVQIILSNALFRQVSRMTLKNNFNFYTQNGILHETLCKYPELLAVVDSEFKLKEAKRLPYNINEVAVLILLSPMNLIKFVYSELKYNKNYSKIAILSSFLEVSPQEACAYIAQKPFLLTLSNDKIRTNIKTLITYGVTKEAICKDLWVLRYSDASIKTRLSIARERNIDTMKTWMVRAQEGVFQTHIRRRSDNKSVLGDNSLAEYLSEKLECNEELANYIILKQPALKNKNLKKLEELIDFLYNEGFKPQHVCRVPKILLHSVETTRKRLKQLEEKDIKLDSLSILTKSQNQFMQYYDALVKSKNKSKTET